MTPAGSLLREPGGEGGSRDAPVRPFGAPRRSLSGSARPRHPLELDLEVLRRERDGGRRWRQAFGAERPLRLEIGVGNSDFLIEVALKEPDYNYLGFEYSAKRVAKFLRSVERRAVGSIRMLRVSVLEVLDELAAGLVERLAGGLLDEASLDRIYINFADPWPKRRHEKHRVVRRATAAVFRRLLSPGGGISLRTDNWVYATGMIGALDGEPGLENLSGPGNFSLSPRDPFPTAYERKFLGEGRPIYYLEYRRR